MMMMMMINSSNVAMIYNLWWSESAPEVQRSPLFIVIFAIGIFIISCQDHDDDGWSSWQEMINIIHLSRSRWPSSSSSKVWKQRRGGLLTSCRYQIVTLYRTGGGTGVQFYACNAVKTNKQTDFYCSLPWHELNWSKWWQIWPPGQNLIGEQ